MPTLLELRDARKRYGHRVLLDSAAIALSDQYKVGLIGRNGAGKSTICRILLDEEELDAGELTRHSDLRLGYLRQHDPFHPGESVLHFLMRDSGQPDWRCGETAAQFELKGPLLEKPVCELSGGWQTRVKLAALLLHDPNFLLLDEPTNFLDLRTQLLLEEFLRGFRGAALVVSHDRAFLKATCDRTLELSRGKLTMYAGDVDAYLENLAERKLHDERVNEALLAKRKHLETFIAKNRANAATASQARSKARQLEKLELTEVEAPETTVRIRMPTIEHGMRVGIVGDNGQGKTTFLRTIAASLDPLAGSFRWGYGCDIGVYAQHVYANLDGSSTVFEYLAARSTAETKTQAVLDMAGSFLFRGDDVNKKISVLSGGERARLVLAGLLLGKHNVLLLDEPGNHLDVESVEALTTALHEYAGTIVFTSHDRYFMSHVATGVVEVRDNRVIQYPGKYDDYVYRVTKEVSDGLRESGGASPAKLARPAAPQGTKGAPRASVDKKPAGRQQWEQQKELQSLERQIEKHDRRKRELEQQIQSATTNEEIARLKKEIAEIAGKVAPLEERWLELHTALEG